MILLRGTQVALETSMKRLFPPVLPVFMVIVALGAGCRRSTAPPATKTADASGAAAGHAPGAPSPGPQQPGPHPPDTLGPTGQPVEAPVKPVPAVLPKVVAKVNGEEIQGWELNTALKQAEASAGGPVPADKRDVVLRGILDELVTYHMLAQEARGRKIEVSDGEVDAEMAKIRQSFPTEDAYKQALLQRGVTADQLRQQERRTLQTQKVVDAEVTSKLSVQDADVDAFYHQNPDRFKQGETVHASHIFIAVPSTATAAQKEQARAKATEILKQLRGGADFAALAKEQSNDSTSANGGDLGFFGKGDMPPDFEAVAWGLKPGAMSGVVELGLGQANVTPGFHIIKVHERRGPRTVPLTEVREQVKAFLLQGQRQAKLEQFINETKAKTKVQILV